MGIVTWQWLAFTDHTKCETVIHYFCIAFERVLTTLHVIASRKNAHVNMQE